MGVEGKIANVPRLGYVGIWLRTVKKNFTDLWGHDFSLLISLIFLPHLQ